MAKELAIVRHVFHLRRKGKTLRAIAALLNRDEVTFLEGDASASATITR